MKKMEDVYVRLLKVLSEAEKSVAGDEVKEVKAAIMSMRKAYDEARKLK